MIEKIFTIPIYDCTLRVIVCKDVVKARVKYPIYGKFELTNGPFSALCSCCGPNFGLFFDADSAHDINTVAHEVFHLTHRMLDWTGQRFDSVNHEAAALLHGYLMKTVAEALHELHSHKPSKKKKSK